MKSIHSIRNLLLLVLIMHTNGLSLFHASEHILILIFVFFSGEFGSFTFLWLKIRFVWVWGNVHSMNTQNRLHKPNQNEDTQANLYYFLFRNKHVVSVYSLHNIWIVIIVSCFVWFSDIGHLFIVNCSSQCNCIILRADPIFKN